MKKKLSIALAVLLPFATFFWGYAAAQLQAQGYFALPGSQAEETNRVDLEPLWRVWDLVQNRQIDGGELTDTELLDGAMKGVVQATQDPYSEYLTAEESDAFLGSLESELTGIGAEIGMRDGRVTVISPLRGSPAEAAGLQPEDFVFKIDGELTADLSIDQAVHRIRGAEGSTVQLSIIREGEADPLEFTITRAKIHLDSVTFELKEEPAKIGVITVASFAEATVAEFDAALKQAQDAGAAGLVIDVRFNGGGYLDGAVALASRLLPAGTPVVSINERGKEPTVLKTITAQVLPAELPVVVLVNGGSASASEILAGALQDAGRAQIIGEKTFGKGTVQELLTPFADGSVLKLTIAKWFTPSGRDVTAESIEPDLVVEATNADLIAKKDAQLERALAELAAAAQKTAAN